jgi:anti-sigma factor RsiW
MQQADQFLQRYLDGELDAAQSAAMQHMLAGDERLRAQMTALERLGGLLTAAHLGKTAEQESLARICAKLPNAAPMRQRHMRVIDVMALTAFVAMTALIYGLVGSFEDFVPLSLIAILSMVVGGALLALAQPLQEIKTGLLSKLFQRRFNLGCSDVTVYRAIGLTIFVGGLWLAYT